MGHIFEKYFDGIKKCKCGSNIFEAIFERVTIIHADLDKGDYWDNQEFEDEDYFTKIICSKCKKEVNEE